MDRNDEVIILQNPETFTENITYCFGNKSREMHEESRGDIYKLANGIFRVKNEPFFRISKAFSRNFAFFQNFQK